MKKLTLSLLLLFIWATLPSLRAQQAQDSRVMIQGFNWESSKVTTDSWYNIIASKAIDLKDSKIDMIWMPPPSDAASIEGYLPRKLYDLNSYYGTQAQLQNCINTLHANGVEAIADIVINHRVGVNDWADFQQPAWGCWGVVANDEWGANGGNPCGSWDSGDNYGAARDIDHTNPTVQSDLTAWMNWLKNDIGFDGWRYDYVRGFNGQYNGIYNNGTSPSFSVGELWDNLDLNNPDPHRQQITNWISQTGGNSTAFDFTTKGILQQAVNGELWRLDSNGGAPGVIGWWPSKAVTFLDNHDTGSTQAHWPFPSGKIMQGYAYILTHPGVPTIFWDHFYDWGLHDEIKALVNIRKENGLHSESQLDIQIAEWNRYGAIIDNKVAMKIGDGNWAPSGNDWNLVASGNGYAVWTKGTVVVQPTETITVRFKPDGFTNPTVYFWQENNGNPTSSTTWPGETMADIGDGWYSYEVPSVGTCSNMVFSNSGTNKTDDLNRCGDGWYDGANWSDNKPTTGPIGGGDGFTVHFKPSGYSNPTIYFWATDDGSSTTWPGVTMTPEADGWYAYTFPTADCANIIFSNSGASKTTDLNRCGDGWYDGSNWSDTQPGGSSTGGDFTVYFKPTNYSNPTIYFWATDNGETTTWPGELMTNEGNGWYSYTFIGGNCANMIFSNSGSSQTADLNRCGNGWYINGSWSGNQPNARYSRGNHTATEVKAYEVGNYPNPFSKQTTITFNQLEKGHVTLQVFNLLGKEVATLIDEELAEGNHEVVFQSQGQQTGIYIYRLTIGDRMVTKRMILK